LNRSALSFTAMAILAAAPAHASHPQDFASVLRPFLQAGDITPAEKMFLKDANSPGRNQLLYLYEMASLYRMVGEVGKSIDLFAAADQVAHAYEGKAVISASGSAGQVGAAMTNDTTLPWEGACCDKVMSRTLDAMNYLARQDLEGARVEVKKAEEYQVQERDKRQKAVASAQNRDQQAGNAALASPGMVSNYQDMNAYARNVRNSYENAFTYYLSSQIYCAQGAAGQDDAMVDIRRAYELAPGVPAVQAAYLDLAIQAQDEVTVANLKARLGVGPGYRPPDHARTGTVVVIFEAGFVPPMSEVAIDVPVAGKLFSLAFPIYRDFRFPVPILQIQTPGGVRSTSKIVDMRLLEIKSLQERMPAIITRGILGAAGKIAAQQKAQDRFGFLGGFASAVATKLVTNADLRSWLSLPAEVQTAQLNLQSGHNELILSAYDWTERVAVDVTPGTTTFLMIKAVPGFRTIKTAAIKPAL
jgi:hypothetical protein